MTSYEPSKDTAISRHEHDDEEFKSTAATSPKFATPAAIEEVIVPTSQSPEALKLITTVEIHKLSEERSSSEDYVEDSEERTHIHPTTTELTAEESMDSSADAIHDDTPTYSPVKSPLISTENSPESQALPDLRQADKVSSPSCEDSQPSKCASFEQHARNEEQTETTTTNETQPLVVGGGEVGGPISPKTGEDGIYNLKHTKTVQFDSATTSTAASTTTSRPMKRDKMDTFYSPPSLTQHLDYRSKAEIRKAELEELRRKKLATPQAARLFKATAPEDHSNFEQRQRELMNKDRQNQLAARERLHQYRADEQLVLSQAAPRRPNRRESEGDRTPDVVASTYSSPIHPNITSRTSQAQTSSPFSHSSLGDYEGTQLWKDDPTPGEYQTQQIIQSSLHDSPNSSTTATTVVSFATSVGLGRESELTSITETGGMGEIVVEDHDFQEIQQPIQRKIDNGTTILPVPKDYGIAESSFSHDETIKTFQEPSLVKEISCDRNTISSASLSYTADTAVDSTSKDNSETNKEDTLIGFQDSTEGPKCTDDKAETEYEAPMSTDISEAMVAESDETRLRQARRRKKTNPSAGKGTGMFSMSASSTCTSSIPFGVSNFWLNL